MRVVFDVGRVLLDANMDWTTIVNASGLTVAQNPFAAQPLYTLPEYEPYESGQLASDDYLEALRGHFGLASKEEAITLHRSILGAEFEGVGSLIQELLALDVPIATLSNNNPIHWQWITVDGPFPGIQQIPNLLCSYQLGFAKPQREIFSALESQLGWTADEIIFFDDSEKYLAGARAAGWNGVLIEPGTPSVIQIRRALDASGVLPQG